MTEKNSQKSVEAGVEEQISLEEMFESLEDILEKMEGAQVSLEESFQLYKQGMTILKKCNDKIDKVEKEVLILDESGGLYEF
ncbi:MAG: exodeoxyribonuclease VII small subunit [Ruminococcus sp.]|nr:exodeoxyribonuclease VII small subunit [Ruminococcus sp.]